MTGFNWRVSGYEGYASHHFGRGFVNNPSAGPASVKLRELTMGMRAFRALHAAAQLGIADHLAAGLTTTAELAAVTACDRLSLRRLLRALSSLGVSRGSTRISLR